LASAAAFIILSWSMAALANSLYDKLGILHLHMVLQVDNPTGMGLHLLTGDVEQHTGVVPSMLGVTKAMVNLL
jgi:hypothetical protein